MATVESPAIRIYRRPSARFGSLRDALARGDFHVVTPPDALADWEYVDDAGTRVRGAGPLIVVEAVSAAVAEAFDARYRVALPSERAIPDGGAPPECVDELVGSDESGKGDRAQALVVAAVLVPCARERELMARGVRDSKTCDGHEVRALSRWIQREFAHEVRVIGPEARNSALRAHGGNESRLLAALHADCIGALRGRQECVFARVDRFAPGRPVAALLGRVWTDLVVDECVRGERHVAVAAASIVARSLTRDASQ